MATTNVTSSVLAPSVAGYMAASQPWSMPPTTVAPPPVPPHFLDRGNQPPLAYTRVVGGSPNGKTTLHAVIDYDYDEEDGEDGDVIGREGDYYDQDVLLQQGGLHDPSSQYRGPIATKHNNTLPVVPLYSIQSYSNGTILHIPILWTALSLALGLEIRGDVIRGAPCIKKHHQLFCPSAGNQYPLERIELFIDENKALIRRMYGEFQQSTEYGPPGAEVYESQRGGTGGGGRSSTSGRSSASISSHHSTGRATSYTYSSSNTNGRHKRQSLNDTNTSETGRVDACQSKVEIVTPFWAANSAGKVRAIVNTQHFEQAIHQEVCSKSETNRCRNDCGCEQKYKWHRLLAYDPDNDCKGIFMDWFLFPSCCVCRCQPFGN